MRQVILVALHWGVLITFSDGLECILVQRHHLGLVDLPLLKHRFHAQMLRRIVFHERGFGTERLDEWPGARRSQDRVLGGDTWRHGTLVPPHDLLRLLLVKQDILLHLLEINRIIKVNNVLGLPTILINNTLRINLRNVILVMEKIGILVNDDIKRDLLHL